MENLGKLISSYYNNKKVLVTGHTGFTGSWLSLWLDEIGAQVLGISLPDDENCHHFKSLNLNTKNFYFDICERNKLYKVLEKEKPEIIFHLASQAIVKKSIDDPAETMRTNILGLSNLLHISSQLDSLKKVLIVTSDKCYKNDDKNKIFVESSQLGGLDPYSCSKSCQELITTSFYYTYFLNKNIQVSTARAGNIIGGGDWSSNRLIPDIIRSLSKKKLEVRSPKATRPWQFILDVIYAYLSIPAQDTNLKNVSSYNVAPQSSSKSVEYILNKADCYFKNFNFEINNKTFKESETLSLDTSKIRREIGWSNKLSIDEAINKTFDWYSAYRNGNLISRDQLIEYIKL